MKLKQLYWGWIYTPETNKDKKILKELLESLDDQNKSVSSYENGAVYFDDKNNLIVGR